MKRPKRWSVIGVVVVLLVWHLESVQALSQGAVTSGEAGKVGHSRVHFNSTLLSEDGKPMAGVHLLTFYIYGNEEGRGDPLWTETLLVKSDEKGNYAADLMSAAPAAVANLVNAHPLLYVRASVPGSASLTETRGVTTIPQAIYQDCNLDGASCSGPAGDTATSQLEKIAEANFSVVLNYSVFWGTEEELLAYAAYANSHGLQIMWTFNDPDFAKYAERSGRYLIEDYSEISATCDCSTNKGFLQYLVRLVKDLPATYGYSIADEPTPNTAADVENLYNIIWAVDPKHPQMVNATWNNATAPSLADLQRYLDPFSFADILGADYYPVGTGAPASYTAKAASDVHDIASSYGKSAEMALQAFNWGQYPQDGVCSGSQCRYPTPVQLEIMMRDAVTDAKPKIIFWYDYWDTVDAGQWTNFVRAVNPQR